MADQVALNQPLEKPVVCTCKKSYCLKLYCDCFRKGLLCGEICTCLSCNNNALTNERRVEAVNLALQKNPNAFKAKKEKRVSSSTEPIKGCHCVKSHCLKKYCECFQVRQYCDETCRCTECENKSGFVKDTNLPNRNLGEGYNSLSEYSLAFLGHKKKVSPPSVTMSSAESMISDAAIDQVCHAVLLQASQHATDDTSELKTSKSSNVDPKVTVIRTFIDSLQKLQGDSSFDAEKVVINGDVESDVSPKKRMKVDSTSNKSDED